MDKIKRFAQKNGYDGVEDKSYKWKGYTVYIPSFADSETHYIGLPYVILQKDNKLRMSTEEEAFAYLDYSNS